MVGSKPQLFPLVDILDDAISSKYEIPLVKDYEYGSFLSQSPLLRPAPSTVCVASIQID
jgi:hypothetical protein